MVIYKPFPLETPLTSTNYPGVKCLTDSIKPTGNKFSLVTLNSCICFLSGMECFKKCPKRGLVIDLMFASPAPI